MKENRKIKDIFIASFLKTIGKNYIGTEKELDGKINFIFEDDKIDEAIDEYVNGCAIGNIPDFVQAYRSFKSVIYQNKERKNG